MDHLLLAYHPDKNVIRHLEDTMLRLIAVKKLFDEQITNHTGSVHSAFFKSESTLHNGLLILCGKIHNFIVDIAEKKFGCIKYKQSKKHLIHFDEYGKCIRYTIIRIEDYKETGIIDYIINDTRILKQIRQYFLKYKTLRDINRSNIDQPPSYDAIYNNNSTFSDSPGSNLNYYLRYYDPNKTILQHLDDTSKLIHVLRDLYDQKSSDYESSDRNMSNFFKNESSVCGELITHCILLGQLIASIEDKSDEIEMIENIIVNGSVFPDKMRNNVIAYLIVYLVLRKKNGTDVEHHPIFDTLVPSTNSIDERHTFFDALAFGTELVS